MQKRLCEIAGKRYMSPSAAADLWQMKYQAVTTACKESRIIGACTDSAGKWIIPIDAMMPMEYNKIRELLLCTLALKNRYDENLITLSVKDVRAL